MANDYCVYVLMRHNAGKPDVFEVTETIYDNGDVFVCRISGISSELAAQLDASPDPVSLWPQLVGLPWQVVMNEIGQDMPDTVLPLEPW